MQMTQLPESDVLLTERLYDEYHKKYGMEDGWDKGNKEYNFYRLMHLVELTGFPISGASCLDVGCGTGDLSLFLKKRGARRYVGIDVYSTSITEAKKKYPQEKFIHKDFLQATIRTKFDYAFCSGALTVKLSVNNYDFLETVIKKMWKLTKVGIAFNVLTDDDPFPDQDLFFYNIKKVRDICQAVAPTAQIKTLKNETTAQSHFYLFR